MLQKIWLRLPIKRKIDTFTAVVVLIMLFSVGMALSMMHFSTAGYQEILEEDMACQDFMDAMNQEGLALHTYFTDETDNNREDLDAAIARAERSVSALPFDYERIGAERYARTWNIRNAYNQYKKERDLLLTSHAGVGGMLTSVYRLYDRQNYLETYARKLLQLTVEAGSDTYEEKLPVFQKLPFVLLNIMLILLFILFRVSGRMTEAIVRPVLKLSEDAVSIAKGNLDTPDIVVENEDELGSLADVFNRMKHATRDNIDTIVENHRVTELLQKEKLENIEMEKRLELNRLELLKSQINPHFLFNTLNMIGSMAELEDAETTEKMTESLASLFRYNLSTKEQIVPISSELRIAEDYMYLQKMRFGSRINYEVILPENQNIRIPSFTMQPLVENAIVHGLSKKETGGTVTIHVQWANASTVTIDIKDDGLGMPKEALTSLQEKLTKQSTAKIGIGLGNIYLRIKHLYQHGDLKIASEEGKGTTVTLTIPQNEEIPDDRKIQIGETEEKL